MLKSIHFKNLPMMTAIVALGCLVGATNTWAMEDEEHLTHRSLQQSKPESTEADIAALAPRIKALDKFLNQRSKDMNGGTDWNINSNLLIKWEKMDFEGLYNLFLSIPHTATPFTVPDSTPLVYNILGFMADKGLGCDKNRAKAIEHHKAGVHAFESVMPLYQPFAKNAYINSCRRLANTSENQCEKLEYEIKALKQEKYNLFDLRIVDTFDGKKCATLSGELEKKERLLETLKK